jgi:hypothetical protein
MSIDSVGCIKVDIGLLCAFVLEHCPAFGEQDGVSGASVAGLLNESLKKTSRHQPCATKEPDHE